MPRDERLFKSLSYIFNESQDGAAGHQKLILKCQQILKESEFSKFFETFTNVMQPMMITMQKNAHIDRTIDFIAKFAASINHSDKQKLSESTLTKSNQQQNTQTMMDLDQTENDLGNPFLTNLIEHLIEVIRANCDAVRYRCCQLLSKIMNVISNDQSIDEDMYDRLCDALLERLKDINSRVQVQAISAIYRLQDPNDRDCRVIKALLFLMSYDPHWQVRFQALANVAFSKQTLPEIIDRVRDPHPQVRRKALVILSEKVLIKFISIEKRLFILNYSLKDQDETVVDTCCKKLLPSWLAFKENDLCKLLKALDVVDSTETCELMLNKMYAENSLESLCKDFTHLINEKHVIPLEKLDAESVFYWHWICSRCKGQADQTTSNKKNDNKENEISFNENRTDNDITQQIDGQDHLDSLLPSLTEYCEYIEEALKKLDAERIEKSNDERYQIENTFMIKKLINIFTFIDFSDVHGKKNLTNLCHKIFSNKNYIFLFESLMKVYKILYPNLQQRINNLVELISDIKDPNPQQTQTETEQEKEHNEMDASEPTSATILSNLPTDPNQSILTPQEIQFKISELRFQRFKLKDDFDNIYKEFKNVNTNIDMNRLTELRGQIKQVEDEIANLQAQLTNSVAPAQMQTNETPQQQKQHQTINEAQTQNEEPEPVDPIELAYHCLSIAICLLEDVELKTLTPQIRSLCDSLILPNISSVNEDLRAISVLALGLVCILKLEMAQKYVPLFLEVIQRDKKEIVLQAFKSMINCIMAFSVNKLVSSSNPTDTSLVVEATSKIMSVMTSLLDHDDSEVYTMAVEGFCKLYMTGHILSAKLFSKLLIMYYSPLTENDVKLRAFLSAFLPQFSFFRSANQLCVEESFMLTLKCLINAPVDSYLSGIDLIKVMETLFNLTNPKNLMQRNSKAQNTNICHENIVKSICYEILKDDNAYKFKIYLKVLQMADLSDADYLSLKNIFELAEEVHDHIEDKLIKKMAKKFSESIHDLLTKKPEYKEEQKIILETEKPSLDTTKKVENKEEETVNDHQNDSTNNNNKSTNEIIDYEFPKLNKKAKQLLNKNDNNSTIFNKTLKETNDQSNKTINNSEKTMIEQLDQSKTTRRSSPRITTKTKSKITIEPNNSNKTKSDVNKETNLCNTSSNLNLKEVRILIDKIDLKQNRRSGANIVINETLEDEQTNDKNNESQKSQLSEDDSNNETEIEVKTKRKKFKNDNKDSNSLKRTSERRTRSARRSQSANNSDNNSQERYEPPIKIARETRSKKSEPESQNNVSNSAQTRSSLRSQSAQKKSDSDKTNEAKAKTNQLKVVNRASSNSATRQETRKSPRNKK